MDITNELHFNSSDQIVNLTVDSLSELTRYGQWTGAKEGRYLIPVFLSGSDYSGNLVERSNYKAFDEAFNDGCGQWWESVSGGHGTFAIVIDMQKVPDDVAESVIAFFNDLEDYPSADDDLLSKLEIKAEEKAWNDWAKSEFIRGIEKKFDTNFDDRPDDQTLVEVFYACGDRIGEYWVNEQGDSMYIDIEEIVKEVTEEDVLNLQMSAITHEDTIKRMQRAEKQVESLKAAVIKVYEQGECNKAAASELEALKDAYGISSMDWERAKVTGKLPADGYFQSFQGYHRKDIFF